MNQFPKYSVCVKDITGSIAEVRVFRRNYARGFERRARIL